MKKQLSIPAQAAKQIRQILKKEFPSIKARVTSSSFAGGTAVDIHIGGRCATLDDGFTVDKNCPNYKLRKDVEFFVNKFQRGHFDGMTDSYEYSNVDESIPQVKYVMVSSLS